MTLNEWLTAGNELPTILNFNLNSPYQMFSFDDLFKLKYGERELLNPSTWGTRCDLVAITYLPHYRDIYGKLAAVSDNLVNPRASEKTTIYRAPEGNVDTAYADGMTVREYTPDRVYDSDRAEALASLPMPLVDLLAVFEPLFNGVVIIL